MNGISIDFERFAASAVRRAPHRAVRVRVQYSFGNSAHPERQGRKTCEMKISGHHGKRLAFQCARIREQTNFINIRRPEPFRIDFGAQHGGVKSSMLWVARFYEARDRKRRRNIRREESIHRSPPADPSSHRFERPHALAHAHRLGA
jgi:hypothetical protein